MDFGLSDEQRLFQGTVRRFALERLAPRAREWESGAAFSRELLGEFAALGTLSLRVPPEHGGTDSPFTTVGVAAEETARGDFGVASFVFNHTIMAEAMRAAGAAVRERYLAAVGRGEVIVAFGLTEPAVGSDAANISTSAVCGGDAWELSGEKASVTFAGLADLCLLFARTGGQGAGGVSVFVVPLELPGVSRRVYRDAGEALVQRGSIFFDRVTVPLDHLVGDRDRGFVQAMSAFDFNRALIGLACLGSAQQSLDETIAYARERTAFGRPLAGYEGVSFQLAEHLTRVEAARLLCYRALWLRDKGERHAREAAMAKWLSQTAAFDAVHACLLLHGHYGYTRELPHEMRLRDVLGLQIGDGTAEIMKLIIARESIGKVAVPYR